MEYDLVTFGEAMVRLTAANHMRLEQARRLDVSVGGAEWNVAINVSRLGLTTAWISSLVDTWAGRTKRVSMAWTHLVWYGGSLTAWGAFATDSTIWK